MQASATVISGGFNVTDRANGADPVFGSGLTFTNGDKQAAFLVSPVSFKPIAGGGALNVITTRPPGYPETDFYGAAIPATNAAAGAIQTATGTGYVLDYAATGSGTVSAGGTTDEDGLRTGGSAVTLTAQAGANRVFVYWTIDGVEQGEQPTPHELTVTMDAHKTVRAAFGIVASSGDNSGPGSLREALAEAGDGDTIVLAGQTITLTALLPSITKNIVIEGNGATLTRTFSTNTTTSQLLRIGSSRIRRLHFKGGRATDNGAAIYNSGILILESCVFSDNRTTGTSGGAIYNYVNTALTVSGCTFYENATTHANGNGGAIYLTNGTVTLTGNVFWGNTAGQNSVVYGTGSAITSGGFNVSDKAATGSGWTFATGDAQLFGLSFDTDFRPSPASLPAIPSPPVGDPSLFPLRYFDGTLRTAGSAPGAMPAAPATPAP
jgi:predicted outer membrane repeat protein